MKAKGVVSPAVGWRCASDVNLEAGLDFMLHAVEKLICVSMLQ